MNVTARLQGNMTQSETVIRASIAGSQHNHNIHWLLWTLAALNSNDHPVIISMKTVSCSATLEFQRLIQVTLSSVEEYI